MLVLLICLSILSSCNSDSDFNKSGDYSIEIGEGVELYKQEYHDSITDAEHYSLIIRDSLFQLFDFVKMNNDTFYYLYGPEDIDGQVRNIRVSVTNGILKSISFKDDKKESVWAAYDRKGRLFEMVYYEDDIYRFKASFLNDSILTKAEGTAILKYGTRKPIGKGEAAVAHWETAIPKGCKLRIKLCLLTQNEVEVRCKTYEVISKTAFGALNVSDPGTYILRSEYDLICQDSIVLNDVLDHVIIKID